MPLLPTRWCDLKPPCRVMDPSGRVFFVTAVLPALDGPPIALLTEQGTGTRYPLPVADLQAFVPVVWEPEDSAIKTLSSHFHIELVR